MKILLLTPLFPPDTGDPATYVKELATKLEGHEVTVLMYGYLPESVPHVTIVSVDKRTWLPARLFRYTYALLKYHKDAERIIVNNAPSTELPALLVSLLRPCTMILCMSDPIAIGAAQSGPYKIIHHLLKHRCSKSITLPHGVVYKKAEVVPFVRVDEPAQIIRDTWWRNHINELTTV